MKRNLNRTTILAAALLTLGAAAAYAQNDRLTAKIPFSFRAVGSDLPAGQYVIGKTSGTTTAMELRSVDTGKSVLVLSKTSLSESSKDVRPRLIFQCDKDGGCSLAKLWSGTGSGLEFSTPPLTASQKERRETVYLDRFKEK